MKVTLLDPLPDAVTLRSIMRTRDIGATALWEPAGPVEVGPLSPPHGQRADCPPRTESLGMVIVRWAVIVLFAILVAVARQAAISRPVVASERQDTPRAAALTDDTRTERAAATLGGEPLAPAGFGWG